MAKALTRAGATVVTVADRRTFVHRTPRLLRELTRTPADVVLVGFPGHSEVALARAVGALAPRPRALRRLRLALRNGGGSRDGAAGQRRAPSPTCSRTGWRARSPVRVICDTDDARRLLREPASGVPRRKLRHVWVGCRRRRHAAGALPRRPEPFRVFVYASFIPLHGLEHVVRAAHVLERAGEDIRIDVVGSRRDGSRGQGSRRRPAGAQPPLPRSPPVRRNFPARWRPAMCASASSARHPSRSA